MRRARGRGARGRTWTRPRGWRGARRPWCGAVRGVWRASARSDAMMTRRVMTNFVTRARTRQRQQRATRRRDWSPSLAMATTGARGRTTRAAALLTALARGIASSMRSAGGRAVASAEGARSALRATTTTTMTIDRVAPARPHLSRWTTPPGRRATPPPPPPPPPRRRRRRRPPQRCHDRCARRRPRAARATT